jgi:hypothetical protein
MKYMLQSILWHLESTAHRSLLLSSGLPGSAARALSCQSTAQASKVLRIGDNDVSAEQLWMPVMHAGGFDAVSSQKCWAAIGRHFNPPKCASTLNYLTELPHSVMHMQPRITAHGVHEHMGVHIASQSYDCACHAPSSRNMTDLSHKVKKAFEQHLLPFELVRGFMQSCITWKSSGAWHMRRMCASLS